MSDIDQYYQIHARDLVNFLFDKGFLHDDLSRESVDLLEDYLAFIFQSQCELAVKGAELLKSTRGLMARQKPITTKEEVNAAQQAEG